VGIVRVDAIDKCAALFTSTMNAAPNADMGQASPADPHMAGEACLRLAPTTQ